MTSDTELLVHNISQRVSMGTAVNFSQAYMAESAGDHVYNVIISSSRTSHDVVRMQMVDGCMATRDCEANTRNSEAINSPICDGELV